MSDWPQARDGITLTPTPIETDPSEQAHDASAVLVDLDAARLKAALPGVVSRCMGYSAAPRFDVALIDAVQAFYGIDVDVATAETDILEDDSERVRFFPWFLWEWQNEAHPETVGAMFAREAELSSVEKRLVAALSASRVWFWEVRAVTRGATSEVELQDIGGRRRVTIKDTALAEAVVTGEILQARIVHVRTHRRAVLHLVDAIYVCLPAVVRPQLVSRLRALGLKDEASLCSTKDVLSPELMELAEELLDDALGVPTPEENVEETLVTARIGCSFTEVLARTGAKPSCDERACVLTVPAYLGAPAFQFVVEDRGSSHARLQFVGADGLDRVIERLAIMGLPLTPLHAERPLGDAVAAWIADGAIPAWALLLPDVARAIQRGAEDWAITFPELIHPALGRRPREAVQDAWSRRAVETLLDRLEGTLPASLHSVVAIVRTNLGLTASH